jgi:hypothetical protein
VVADARAFAEANGMSEYASLFGRAALVARDPARFEALAELDEEERHALTYERDHKWHGPKMLWYSIGLCAIGAATQGWDQTGSNGANLSFPEEFKINTTAKDEWIVGLINSIIFLTAGLMYVSCLLPCFPRTANRSIQRCLHCRPLEQIPRPPR